jgi:hypothetical protein
MEVLNAAMSKLHSLLDITEPGIHHLRRDAAQQRLPSSFVQS